tara:strand:+ start:1959 stop:2561 length:603 start_codon:yes stop_codon:yes gene_type:complete
MASTSLTNTNISDTYVGVLHAKGEPIPASGLEDVYDGFGNKSALKIGQTSIDVDGELGAGFTTAAGKALYPVGSVIFSIDNNNPGARFDGTAWQQVAEGRFVVGTGSGNDGTETKAYSAGEDTTGKYNHPLTTAEMPAHNHPVKWSHGGSESLGGDTTSAGNSYNGNDRLSSDYVQSTGGNTPHNNTPPAFGMYMWQRIS